MASRPAATLRWRRLARIAACFLAAGLATFGCGADDDGGAAFDEDGGDFGTPGTGGTGSGGTAASGGTGGAADAGLPPEQEIESSFRAPVVTGKFIWSANPDSNRVALIDSETLKVRILEAGFAPTHVAALQSSDDDAMGAAGSGSGDDAEQENAAIVLNVLSEDATVFRVQSDGSVSSLELPTHALANSVAAGPTGRWAIAWTDARGITVVDPVDGFQDVTVLDLEADAERATRLSVGYRPSQVAFDPDASRAYVVTEPGISVIALDTPSPEVVDLIEVSDDPFEDPDARDVTFSPDGEHALVRIDGRAEVIVVSLADKTRLSIPMAAPITDLDLSADGSRAVAVMRDTSSIAVLELPDILDTPGMFDTLSLTDELVGSVALAPNGERAVLFTNAVASQRVVTVNLAAGDDYLSHRSVDVKSAVQGVFLTPDGQHAIALGALEAETGAGAFSIIPTAVERSPKIVGTEAPPQFVALDPRTPSERALVTTRDDDSGTFALYLVRMPSLQVDRIGLSSPPLAAGIAAGSNRGYVAQQHPEGRITFVDLDEGSARTLTGFELATKVVD